MIHKGYLEHSLIHDQGWNEVTQSCPTLFNPMDCSLPHSSDHGIFQARVLERVATSFSRGSSQPGDWTWVSRIVGRHFTVWATSEVLIKHRNSKSCKQLNIFIVYSDLKSGKRQDRKNRRLNPDFRILCIQCARPTGLVDLSQRN